MDSHRTPSGADRNERSPDAEVRAEILASWRRSRLLGIDRENTTLPVESDLDPDSRLLRAAAPVLEHLYERFSGMPVTVVLADARAHIVDRRGDPKGLDLMDAASLVPGANVDERFMGTSSVSMVLSTRAPFVVIGQEHFLHRLQALTCMAAPVCDPIGGAVQGAINLSVPRDQADPGMALVLQEAADRVGERLLELSTVRERELMASFLRDRERGGHARLDLGSGQPVHPGGKAPPLTRQERLTLLENATELISSGNRSFAEVKLAGDRTATLRCRPLHHGDTEGAAVEVSFAPMDDTAVPAPPATATAPNGRRVPLLRPSSPAESPAERPRKARSGPVEPADHPDAWLLLVGEPSVGRLAVEARRRLSLLNDAGARVGTTLDMRRTAEELSEVTVPYFADIVVVDLVEGVLAGEEPPSGPLDIGTALRRVVVRTDGDLGGTRTDRADVPLGYTAGTPQARAIAGRRPVADSVPNTAPATHFSKGAHPLDLLGEGDHSYLGAPLCARGAVLGLVGFYRRGRTRPYEEDDLVLADELATRTAISLDNARRFSREHDASLTLQHSLLPRDTPRLNAVDLAFRYRPADTRVGVGGDWFDAIPLSGLRVALVVGDVAGHGLHAAATMGRLRTAVRTLADLDLPPEEILAHLDDLVSRTPDDPAMAATCLYAVYDPVSCTCTAAAAGHPPPALALPDGTTRLLDPPTGPPLGLGRLQPYESATVELPRDSLLALYTDGLLKQGRAYETTDTRTEQLLAALRGEGPSLEGICDRITGTLLLGDQRDDVALLLARVHSLPDDQVASWELPADPAMVAEARALTSRQLAEWGLSELEDSTGLVVSELVTNAVRYGGEGPVGLRLLRDTALICEVSDRSNSSPRIRRAAVTEEGGRGLFLVAQFTDSWGARYMPRGKTVWAEQSLRDGHRAPEVDERTLLAMFDDLD
ncbi:SpoIIE family protein phosphatase [Streptomyces macrosporus]|uniref:Protein phosphatase n=1 Tax=Streptomyces macrosporus TaxID=44032 RepID=A0ABP5WQK6_9ACTN